MLNSLPPTLPSQAIALHLLEPLAEKIFVREGSFLPNLVGAGISLAGQALMAPVEIIIGLAMTALSGAAYTLTLGNVEAFRKISVLSLSASISSLVCVAHCVQKCFFSVFRIGHMFRELPLQADLMNLSHFQVANDLSKMASQFLFHKEIDDRDFLIGALSSFYDTIRGEITSAEHHLVKALFLYMHDDPDFFNLYKFNADGWLRGIQEASNRASFILLESPISQYQQFAAVCFAQFCQRYPYNKIDLYHFLNKKNDFFSNDVSQKKEAQRFFLTYLASNQDISFDPIIDSTDAHQIFGKVICSSDPVKAVSLLQIQLQQQPQTEWDLQKAVNVLESIPDHQDFIPITYLPSRTPPEFNGPSGTIPNFNRHFLHVKLTKAYTMDLEKDLVIQHACNHAKLYIQDFISTLNEDERRNNSIQNFERRGIPTCKLFIFLHLLKNDLIHSLQLDPNSNVSHLEVSQMLHLQRMMRRLDDEALNFLFGYVLAKDRFENELKTQFSNADRQVMQSVREGLLQLFPKFITEESIHQMAKEAVQEFYLPLES